MRFFLRTRKPFSCSAVLTSSIRDSIAPGTRARNPASAAHALTGRPSQNAPSGNQISPAITAKGLADDSGEFRIMQGAVPGCPRGRSNKRRSKCCVVLCHAKMTYLRGQWGRHVQLVDSAAKQHGASRAPVARVPPTARNDTASDRCKAVSNMGGVAEQ